MKYKNVGRVYPNISASQKTTALFNDVGIKPTYHYFNALRLGVLASLCFMTFIFACTLSFAAPLQKLTLILDWFPNPDHAPLFVAKEYGFFKAEGLDVNIIGPSDPSDPPKLVAAGKADIALTYQPQLLMQIDQGLPLARIATLIASPLNCLVVRADSPIHSIQDLKGKTIGYSSAGVDHVMLKTMLASHGLSLNDVTLINVHYDLTQALLAKKVDAVTGMMRNFELIQMQLAGVPGRAFYPEENGVPQYSELVLIANKNSIHDPRFPKFIKALTLATHYLIAHPQQTWQTFSTAHPELNNQLNKEAWDKTLPLFNLNPGNVDQARWDNFSKFMQAARLIKTL